MPKETKSVFDNIKGLKKVKPEDLAAFKKVMSEKVIPRIVSKVEARRLRAAKSRSRRLRD